MLLLLPMKKLLKRLLFSLACMSLMHESRESVGGGVLVTQEKIVTLGVILVVVTTTTALEQYC